MEVGNTELLLIIGKLHVEKDILLGQQTELQAEVGSLQAQLEQAQGPPIRAVE